MKRRRQIIFGLAYFEADKMLHLRRAHAKAPLFMRIVLGKGA